MQWAPFAELLIAEALVLILVIFSLHRRTYLTVALMVAAMTVASACASAARAAVGNTGLAENLSAGWASPDDSDERPAVIATGDFNRDGIADMVEALPGGEGRDGSSLVVLLGQADGTFKRVGAYSMAGSGPRALVVGDFNGDGNSDVIVGDGDGVVLEFLGDGRGHLAGPSRVATLGSVASLAAGLFTHDGHLDLVVADVRSNSGVILLGAGDGTFRPVWSFQLPRVAAEFHIATADFNGDGIADLVITTEDDENYEVMLGNGNGTFTAAPQLSHVKDPNSYCPS